jgi:hypothetical protein
VTEQRQPRRMSDRAAWVTPADEVSTRYTEEALDELPIGTVLSVPAGFPKAGSRETIMLSVEKVSQRKWRIHTRSGFDRRHLVGLSARRRQRRGNARE